MQRVLCGVCDVYMNLIIKTSGVFLAKNWYLLGLGQAPFKSNQLTERALLID